MTPTAPLTVDSQVAIAGTVLAHLAAADFAGLADAFEPDLSAIVTLPAGVYEWRDRASVQSVFEQWFGGAASVDVTDFTFGRIGTRLQLRWRIEVAGGSWDRRHVVEQQLYARMGPTGRIASMTFACSGFHAAHGTA